MKQILALFAILAFTVTSQATTLADFKGTWVGTRNEYVNGTLTTYSQRTTFRFVNGSLLGNGTIKSGAYTFKASGTYSPDGTYSAALFYSGSVIAISSGRWNLSGKTIHVSAITRTAAGTQSGRASLQLLNSRTLVSVGNTSAGNVTITLHKR